MKTIEITDEQYELIEQEQEHVTTDMSMVDMVEGFMTAYAIHYGPDPSFTATDTIEAAE